MMAMYSRCGCGRAWRRAAGCGVLLAALVWPAVAVGAPKIGVLLKGTSAFWNAVGDGAAAAARAQGAEAIVRMPVSESDIDVQIRMVDELVREGVAALVIAPSSSAALSDPVAAAAAKGVKIVVIDTAVAAEMPVFVATNHTAAGEAAGRLLATLVKPTDKVAILKHSRTSGATTLREVSAFAALHQVHPGIVVTRDIYAGTEAGKEIEKAHELLRGHPDAAGVLVSGTPGSMAMLQALRESGRGGSIKFVGFGFNLNATVAAALEDGVMHGWIAQLPGDIGGRGVKAALALLEGRSVPEVSFCDFLVITRENLHEPEVQALLPEAENTVKH
jgi:ABC-type sugar transport system, periplasmic component